VTPGSRVAAARTEVDRLRRALLDGHPVGLEFAAAVRHLQAEVDAAGDDPFVPWIARPHLEDGR
jgi:hypothetical protein